MKLNTFRQVGSSGRAPVRDWLFTVVLSSLNDVSTFAGPVTALKKLLLTLLETPNAT